MSWFKFRNLSVIVNCVTKSLSGVLLILELLLIDISVDIYFLLIIFLFRQSPVQVNQKLVRQNCVKNFTRCTAEFSRSKWKILHLAKFFIHPVVMVVTYIKYAWLPVSKQTLHCLYIVYVCTRKLKLVSLMCFIYCSAASFSAWDFERTASNRQQKLQVSVGTRS